LHKKDQRLFKKLLITALAKKPDSFGLVPDENGWIKLKELVKAISQEQRFKHVTAKVIEQFVLLLEKEDFELDSQSKKIRVSYKLRKNLKFSYEISIPPPILFTAIRPKAYHYILTNGFISKENPIVFSRSKELALKRGKWIHNNPLLVTIKAYEAANNGSVFYKVGEEIFLSHYIAPEYIHIEGSVPKISVKDQEKYKPDKTYEIKAPKAETMGSFFMSPDFNFENKKKSSKFKKDKKHKKDPDWKRIRRQKRRR